MFDQGWTPADAADHARQAGLLDAVDEADLLDPDVVPPAPLPDAAVCARAHQRPHDYRHGP